MKAQRLSSDIISTLPSNIIETILCLLPIQEAARTSILSRNWRYNWVTIPKLEFIESGFKVKTHAPEINMDDSFERERLMMTKRCKFVYALFRILLMHRGPIHEFTLTMSADDTCHEVDQIIHHLSRSPTLKKIKLELGGLDFEIPLSIFSFHHLTDISLSNCCLHEHRGTKTSVSGNLTSLYMKDVITSTACFLDIVYDSPLLKSLTLDITSREEDSYFTNYTKSTIFDLFECLPPVLESLTLCYTAVGSFAPDVVPRELPIILVHLKHFCMRDMIFDTEQGLPFLLLLIRSSPNLEKIYLQLSIDPWYDIESVDYSNICLEHLTELEIENSHNLNLEIEFVKFILTKSPVLKKMRIVLSSDVALDKEMKMLRTLLRFPRASPSAEITVKKAHY